MNSINIALVILMLASSLYCLPAPEPRPQFDDLLGIFDIFGIFDSYEDYGFENRNVTSNV